MEKYPKSCEKKKHKHHVLDARIGKTETTGFNYEETVKNLNKYYVLGNDRLISILPTSLSYMLKPVVKECIDSVSYSYVTELANDELSGIHM